MPEQETQVFEVCFVYADGSAAIVVVEAESRDLAILKARGTDTRDLRKVLVRPFCGK